MKTRKLKLSNRVVSILDTKQSQQVRGASQGCDTDSGPMCTIAENECYDTYFCTDDCNNGGSNNGGSNSGGSNSGGSNSGGSSGGTNPCGPSVRNGKLYFYGLGYDWT